MGDIPLFGIDLGYGDVKIAGPGYRHKFPAVAANPSVDFEGHGLVEWDGTRIVVGEGAYQEKTVRRAPDPFKFRSVEEKAKYLAGLAHLARHYDTNVMAIASGLPPAHFKQRDLRAEMAEALTGQFNFRYNGTPYQVTVAGVTVDPQAGAAFYDFYLHDDGSINESNADLAGLRSIVVDPGYNTTDISLMNGTAAALGNKSILTVDRGVWSIFEDVRDRITAETGYPITDTEVERLWRNREKFRFGGREIPIDKLASEASASIARFIVAATKRHAGDTRIWDVALLVGGGLHFFEVALSADLGVPVRIPRHPEYANAAGYFKLTLMR